MTMNTFDKLFAIHQKPLAIRITAGYPLIDDTLPLIKSLQDNGVKMVEISLPFSDPLAEGALLQESSLIALRNGMSTNVLFSQLENMRKHNVSIAIVLTAYINPIMQYGIEHFVCKCQQTGVSAVVIPDMPFDLYMSQYKGLFETHNVGFAPLIASQCSDERIRYIDSNCNSFLYVVSAHDSNSMPHDDMTHQELFYKRLASLGLKSTAFAGFNISTPEEYKLACQYTNGAIVDTAFVRHIAQHGTSQQSIADFVSHYRL